VGKFLTSCKPVSFSRRALLHGVGKSVYLKAFLLRAYKTGIIKGMNSIKKG
jgi:hypothetical protein